MSDYQVGDRPDRGAFIPSCLDDYPLNANEFRVYAHILRRAGTKNTHYETVPNTAKHCLMNVKTARNAIKVLRAAGLISVEERPGFSSILTPTHESLWASPGLVEGIRQKTTPTKTGRGINGTTKIGKGGLPKEDHPPLPKEDHKGSPSKGSPFKEKKEELSLKTQNPKPQTQSDFTGQPKTPELESDRCGLKGKGSAAPPSKYVVGKVTYTQKPDEIDFADMWANNPGMAKERLRYIAIAHKYPALVAHGVGELWVGPKYKDFSEQAIAIAQKRKRDLQQRDDRGAGIGYIENLIKGEKWAALESLLDEAKERSRDIWNPQPATPESDTTSKVMRDRLAIQPSAPPPNFSFKRPTIGEKVS